MKKLNEPYNGLDLYYYEDICKTDFYTKRTVKKKKYWLFGPEISKEKFKPLFTIHLNAESPRITKEMWRSYINKQFELLKRREELNYGKLI